MGALDQIGTYKSQLQRKTLKQDRDFISKLGNELQVAKRRQITSDKIFEVEEFLSDFFIKVKSTPNHDKPLIDAIARARSDAYTLGNHLENEEKLNTDFFHTVYELGKKLESLSGLIGALILPILLSNNLPWG